MRRVTISLVLMFMVICADGFGGSVVLREENDVFADSDRHYTQGLELLYGELITTSSGRKVMRSVGIRNLVYTPSDISIADPQPDDRPWAGLTGLLYEEWEHSKYHYVRTEYIVGMVGDISQSDSMQAWFHELTDSEKPMGWSNQIPNELFVNMTLSYYRPLWLVGSDGWSADVTATYGGSLGTAFVNAEGGGVIRAGWNIPSDYRSALIKPTDIKAGLSAYTFAASDLRYVVHNVTLGGSLFQDGPSQSMEPFVYDMRIGVALGMRKFLTGTDAGLSYSVVQRSREFKGQEEPARFGSITLSVVRAF